MRRFQMIKNGRFRIAIVILLVTLLVNSTNHGKVFGNTQKYPVGINILIFKGQNVIHTDIDGFTANYTSTGNSVTVVDDFDFVSNDLSVYNAILMDTKSNLTDANVTAITSWFNDPNKLLWIASDDDFGGYNVIQNSVQYYLPKSLGTKLRFDAGGLNDAESNDDGGTYRVFANQIGVSSPLVDYVTNGFEYMKFHGPTSIMWTSDNDVTYSDLRNASLTSDLLGVHIVINSSSFAYPLDQDSSTGLMDFYRRSYDTGSAPTGNYPFLVTDRSVGGANSTLIMSGEAVFTDYKRMYGNAWEYAPLFHQGSQVVDNLFAYHFVETLGFDFVDVVTSTVTEVFDTSTTTETSTTSSQTTTPTTQTGVDTTETITTSSSDITTEDDTTTTSSMEISSTPSSESSSNLTLPSPIFFVVTAFVIAIFNYNKRKSLG